MARKRAKTIKLNLRLPADLHRQLEREAATYGQSLNTEMVNRLARSLKDDAYREAAMEFLRDRRVDEVLTESIRRELLYIVNFLTDEVRREARVEVMKSLRLEEDEQ